jgi:hypothetical protein
MGRPMKVPDKGDVPAAVVAARLGLSIGDFDARRAALTESAAFPILILRPDFGAWRPSTDGVCADTASCFLN